MAGFQAQVTTTVASESVTLPLVSGQTYNCTVDWDDGAPVSVTAWDDADATHTYVTPGTYTVTITGQCDGWSVNNTHSSKLQWTDIVYWGDTVDFDGFAYLIGGFYGCSNLASLGTGSILCNGLTSLYYCFYGCPIVSIQSGLFDNCTSITNFAYCFYGCSIDGIPSGLFDYCTLVTTFFGCFANCYYLETIPYGLFKNCTLATNFGYCFLGDSKSQINPWIFYDDGNQSTRFLNQSVSFDTCFHRSSFNGTQGQAPDLWNCNYGSGTPTTNCFTGAGNSLTSLINYNNIPAAWGGSGYVDTPPEFATVDLTDVGNDTEIDITGTDFEASGGSLYACDTDVLSDSSKVLQTIDTQGDTAIGATITGLSTTGTKYLYLIDSDDQITDSPWSITFWEAPAITDIDTDEILLEGQTNVVLTGTNLMNSQGTGKLELSNNSTYGAGTLVEQSIDSWSNTSIQFDVVKGSLSAGTLYAFVTTDVGQVSAAFSVTFYETPTITDIDTDEILLEGQTNIDLTGTDFEASQGTGKLELSDNSTYGVGTLVEQSIDSWNDTAIQFDLVPGSLTNGALYALVTTDHGLVSGSFSVAYYETPTITDIDTDEILLEGQTNIALTGTDFEAAQGTGKLELSDNPTYGAGTLVEQSIDSWNDTTIQFDLVPGSLTGGTLYAFVTTDHGAVSSSFSVTYYETPAITDIDTDEVLVEGQTNIALTGTDLEATQGTGKLELSNNSTYGAGTLVEQTIDSWGDTAIQFDLVPGSLTGGTLYAFVTTDHGAVSPPFSATYYETPAITDIDTDEILLEGQTNISLTGTDFEASQGTGKLELSNNSTYGAGTLVAQSIDSWSDTSIQFDLVPGTLTSGTLYAFVTTDHGAVSPSFSVTYYETPTITDVDTDEVLVEGQTNIILTGTDFEAAQGTGKLELSDNGTYGAGTLVEQSIGSWSDTSIQFDLVLGALTNGTLYVFVTTDHGAVSSSFSITIYETPVITNCSVSTLEDGMTGVTLTGDDFEASSAALWLADADDFASATKVEQSITAQSNTSIVFTAEASLFSTGGTYYLFVETSHGLVNASGYEIEVEIEIEIDDAIIDSALYELGQVFLGSTNYQNFFRALLTPMTYTNYSIDYLINNRGINTSSGWWQDRCGDIIGAPRLPDETPYDELFAFGSVSDPYTVEDLTTSTIRGTSVHLDGKIYTIGLKTPEVYVYDIATETLTKIGDMVTYDSSTNYVCFADSYCIGSDGNIYIAPRSTDFYRINTSTDTLETIHTDITLRKHNGCTAIGDKVLYTPDTYTNFSIYDISTSTMDVQAGAQTPTYSNWNKYRAVTSYGGCAYCFPFGGTQAAIVKMDMSAHTWTQVGSNMPTGSQLYKTTLQVLSGTYIYAFGIFANMPYVWKFDTATDTWSQVANFSGILIGSGTERNFSGHFVQDGLIYLIPREVDSYIVFDPSTDTYSIVDASYPAPGEMYSTDDHLYLSSDYGELLEFTADGIVSLATVTTDIASITIGDETLIYLSTTAINDELRAIIRPDYSQELGFADLAETTGGRLFSYQGNYIDGTTMSDTEYAEFMLAKALANFRGSSLRDIIDFVYYAIGELCEVEFVDNSDVQINFDNPSLDYAKKRIIERYAPVSAGSKILIDYGA